MLRKFPSSTQVKMRVKLNLQAPATVILRKSDAHLVGVVSKNGGIGITNERTVNDFIRVTRYQPLFRVYSRA